MEWLFYIIAFVIGVAITASAVYALHWSSKHGQLRDFEKGAASIFDEKEPIGRPTDFFPQKRRKPKPTTPAT
ncbi:hypothetical protein OH491_25145 [Termitidicoccus mucosus]|uniref:Uncharacterized protein n=1 Tax=Termitidicoccus mucosus TaxID=1184151 RepID=A0A178IPC5_9BACT|nr:hypothetical protein AW736_01400 [Opitutaceae bacterium TSB47]